MKVLPSLGKDRTGLITMLVLSVLGATDEQIVADYVLSDSAYKDINDKKAMVASLKQVKRCFALHCSAIV